MYNIHDLYINDAQTVTKTTCYKILYPQLDA